MIALGKLIKATCSLCGETFSSRTRSASIKKIGDHWRKKHPLALSRRIKTGKAASQQNPGIQEFVDALQTSPRNAIRIYSEWTEYQYRTTQKYMDALKPILPPEVVASWELIEVLHDEIKL